MKGIYLTLLFCLFAVVPAAAQKKKPVINAPSTATNAAQTYHLKKGEQYVFDSNISSDQTMSMMGQDNETKTTTSMHYYITVQEENDNGYTLKMNADTAVIHTKMSGMMGNKDTTMKMGEIAATQNIYKISATGKILSQTSESGNAASKTAQALMRQFSGSGKSDIRLLEYPDVPLTQGYSWLKTSADTNRLGNNGEAGNIITVTSTRYTFDGYTDTLGVRCGRIVLKSEKLNVSGTMKQPGMGGEMTEITVEGDGIVKGAFYFESATGMPVAVLSNTQMDTRMSMSGQMEMVMPVTSDIKASYVRAKKK